MLLPPPCSVWGGRRFGGHVPSERHGVFAMEDIPAGRFVCEVVGEEDSLRKQRNAQNHVVDIWRAASQPADWPARLEARLEASLISFRHICND